MINTAEFIHVTQHCSIFLFKNILFIKYFKDKQSIDIFSLTGLKCYPDISKRLSVNRSIYIYIYDIEEETALPFVIRGKEQIDRLDSLRYHSTRFFLNTTNRSIIKR